MFVGFQIRTILQTKHEIGMDLKIQIPPNPFHSCKPNEPLFWDKIKQKYGHLLWEGWSF